MAILFLFKSIRRINWGALWTRTLVLTSTGRLEQLQKTGNIWQILCQDLEKDDLKNHRALNPCESMRSLTWRAINKESKDTNVNSVSQSDLTGKLLMRTQAWLEEVTHALPQGLRRVFGSPVKTEGFETRLVQGTHIKYSEDESFTFCFCVMWERINLGTSFQ